MKTFFKLPLFLFAFSVGVSSFKSCKPREIDVVRLQSVVSQEIIDELKNKGMRINEGNRPPNLELSVRVSPYELLVPFGDADPWEKGQTIADYFYKFYGQTDRQEITYDYYQSNRNDEGSGEGAFIMGENNRFTIFSEENGVSSGIPNKTVTIISGMLSGDTIEDYQYAFVLTEKTGDDQDQVLIPVGKSRIWIDQDGVSESVSNFRIAVGETRKSGSVASLR